MVGTLDYRSEHPGFETPSLLKNLFLNYVAKNESLILENDFDIENNLG